MSATDPDYGERIASVYDAWYSRDSVAATVVTLARLAGKGPALELGIGTGRIAIPLRQSGVEVHGIDISPAMVEQMRAKPAGYAIPVTLGNFADVGVEGQYSLIYVLFNTLFQLLTQDEQTRCFINVARHLMPGGVFVVEAFVPDLTRFQRNQSMSAVQVDDAAVRFDVSTHDPVTQRVTSQHVLLTEQGTRLYPVKIRYAYPPELDLMARLAGLRFMQRWGSWEQAPFTAESGKHVSIYVQPER